MSYGRVTNDKQPFKDDDDHDSDYRDDPNGNQRGNGVYNHTVKPSVPQNRLQFLCFSCKNTKLVKFVMLGSAIVVLLALILVIVSAVGHKENNAKSNGTVPIIRHFGLFAVGPDDSGNLEIGLSHVDTYMNFVKRMENNINVYSTIRQESNPDIFKQCKNPETFIQPPEENQACMQTLFSFGDKCTNFNLYGMLEGQPCVLLILRLDTDINPEPFNLSLPENVEILKRLSSRHDPSNVGVSCEGKTKADQDLMVMRTVENNQTVEKMPEGGQISYNPANGFPTYFFAQKKRGENYVSPAVMVKFNSIPANHRVTVRCTAWAKNFNDGHPENSTMYTTEFSILIKL
ncbi:sodium/potassium-transporting ATPase subunit beta-1-like [Dreissena polymorpha]|uniref:Uncharacterized protein n=1 Tax=Dreissena polymorpha TaxID=45954 RepID=A0A9D4CGJ4_DREPO|nr:sodium/potassium-transporting ATPase subunit beta-1-like [Dreissena polymorpha]KAH3724276.1 hypothetical protein DPMN_050092 [Dreissena polymorpha]